MLLLTHFQFEISFSGFNSYSLIYLKIAEFYSFLDPFLLVRLRKQSRNEGYGKTKMFFIRKFRDKNFSFKDMQMRNFWACFHHICCIQQFACAWVHLIPLQLIPPIDNHGSKVIKNVFWINNYLQHEWSLCLKLLFFRIYCRTSSINSPNPQLMLIDYLLMELWLFKLTMAWVQDDSCLWFSKCRRSDIYPY